MSDLDDLDLEILELLIDDARRPYSDIADRVDVSGPTVSDRVDRLVDRGVIRRFTIDLDRSRLEEGVGLLVDLDVRPGRGEAVLADVLDIGGVEHAYLTADDRVVASARLNPSGVRGLLERHVDLDAVDGVDVSILERVEWSPRFDATGFDLACDECGNTVTEEGTTARLGGTAYHFCCPSCESRFTERYEELSEAA
ncbi:MAG: winged helix-turn-helix transcriptional regulator [Halobacteriales archaeon]